MLSDIAKDYSQGLLTSLRIDKLIITIHGNQRLRKLFFKICKYNILLHIIPFFIMQLLHFGTLIIYPINIFSSIFHLLHYIDLVNVVSIYVVGRPKTSTAGLDLVSFMITMALYQIVIYLTTTLINLFFYRKLYLISVCLNFFILSIYHSFYCYNNLWNYYKISMNYRIDMHEKLWPFYMGYGTIATIIYMYSDHQYILMLYNLYICLIIVAPFLTKAKYPKKNQSYPSINLSIFSRILGCLLYLTRTILKRDSNPSLLKYKERS